MILRISETTNCATMILIISEICKGATMILEYHKLIRSNNDFKNIRDL
jgi:hypothetical protein